MKKKLQKPLFFINSINEEKTREPLNKIMRCSTLILMILLRILIHPTITFSQTYKATIDGICYQLTENNATSYGSHGYGTAMVISKEGGYSGNVSIPDKVYRSTTTRTYEFSVLSIDAGAFKESSELTSVSIPNNVYTIGDEAFSGCSNLKEIHLPEKYHIGSRAFTDCTKLESIQLNKCSGIGSGAFTDCSGLIVINIPETVESIGDSIFTGCTGLTSIVVNNKNSKYDSRENCNAIIDKTNNNLVSGCMNTTIPSSITSIGNGAFNKCIGLTSISIPESVISIGYSAFKGCTGIITITIPENVSTIGEYAFANCTNLKRVIIPDRVTNVGDGAFDNTLWYNNMPDGLIYLGLTAYKYKGIMPNNTIITIKDGTTAIGRNAFYGCTGLQGISIPNSITILNSSTFSGCTNLTSVTLNSDAIVSNTYSSSSNLSNIFGNQVTEYIFGDSITSIGDYACYSNKNLKSVTIGSSVTNIGRYAFQYCDGLTDVAINSNALVSSGHLPSFFGTKVKEYILGNNITSIGDNAFYNCRVLTSINIPSAVTNIGNNAFSYCESLTSITIPNSVTNIGSSAFSNCKGLTSITIPSSVIAVGNDAFYLCSNLKKVNIEDIAAWCKITFNSNDSNPLYYAKHLFLNDKEITSLEIPNTVYTIRDYAFFNCEGLKSVIIADSVVWICDQAFYGCIGLNSVSVGNNVTSIGQYAFYNCTNLKNTTIGKSVNNIGNYAFQGCTNLSKVTINSNELCSKNYSENNSLQQVFTSAKEYILGEDVNSIGEYALAGTKMEKLTILNPMVTFNENAMKNCTNLRNVYTNRGGTTLLYLWNLGLNTYDVRTFTLIEHPDISFQLTQTTATASVSNYYDEYKYEAYFKKNPNDYYYQEDRPESIEMTDKNYKIKGLKPGAEYNYWMYIKQGDVSYLVNGTYSPTSINPQVDILKKTPTSLHLQGNYTHGDAVFKDQRISFSYNEAENSNIIVKDKLNPNTNYRVKYEVDVLWGENNENTATYKWEDDISTDWIWFDVLEPKVVSVGNVIVASNVNIDDDDAVVGFEWRRMDWPDEISSSTGGAVLYEGTMEGIIRNMNTNYLWKVRPYFKSFDGWDTYYGEWVGFDPSNTSYFQPTVHTYSKVVVNGNTASLKGYAMRGTDNVTSQGFKYWRTTNASSSLKDIDIPSNAQTVTASGQIMTATLTNLEYATNYICVAFVETSEGETFYGEPQTFRTANVTGIEQIQINPDATHATDNNTSESERTIVGYYNLQGQRITQPQKGIVIVRYSDGTSRKMLVK